jgi:hypothetical protein
MIAFVDYSLIVTTGTGTTDLWAYVIKNGVFTGAYRYLNTYMTDLANGKVYTLKNSGYIELKKGDYLEIYADSGGANSATGSLSVAAYDSQHFAVTKLNTGSQTIGKLPVLFEKYNTIASTISNSLTTGGTIIATNKVRSTHGAYNPATGIFTSPDDRLYEVCFAVRHDAPTAASGNTFILLVGGDGVATSSFNHHISMQTSTTVRHSGCTTFYGTKGEQAWLRAFHLNAVGTEPFNGLSQYNWITWRSVD